MESSPREKESRTRRLPSASEVDCAQLQPESAVFPDEEQLFVLELFVLEQALKAWKFYQAQMAQCDVTIEKVLAQLPTAKPAPALVPPKPVATVPAPKQALRKRTQHGPNAAAIDLGAVLTQARSRRAFFALAPIKCQCSFSVWHLLP